MRTPNLRRIALPLQYWIRVISEEFMKATGERCATCLQVGNSWPVI